MRNNRSYPHTGPIPKKFPQNLIIYAQLTMQWYKIQNHSQKNSHSSVPLSWLLLGSFLMDFINFLAFLLEGSRKCSMWAPLNYIPTYCVCRFVSVWHSYFPEVRQLLLSPSEWVTPTFKYKFQPVLLYTLKINTKNFYNCYWLSKYEKYFYKVLILFCQWITILVCFTQLQKMRQGMSQCVDMV